MKKLSILALVPVLAGCMTSSVPDVAHWMIDCRSDRAAVEKPAYGVVRVAHVTIRPPYRSKGLVVLRADGTVAVDSYNEYVAEPAQLLRGVVGDALVRSGLFAAVLPATSIARSDLSVEVDVLSLALDCRKGGAEARTATASLVLRLVDAKGTILKGVAAEGTAPAAEANYGEAISLAFSQALERAIAKID